VTELSKKLKLHKNNRADPADVHRRHVGPAGTVAVGFPVRVRSPCSIRSRPAYASPRCCGRLCSG
jgi:hypothetical protein